METIRIRKTDNPMFDPVWTIYQNSFPLIEQRTPEHQQTAFKSDRYHLNAYVENNKLIGFIGYWEFDDYLYIEHFAINPELRSGGYGSKVLSALQQATSKTIILEIDEVVDEISTRRLNFYQRLGFVMNPYIHPLHVYREKEHRDFTLRILTYPTTIDAGTYKRFNDDLTNIVMKRENAE